MISSFDQENTTAREPTKHKLIGLFCHVDVFRKAFLPQWQKLQLESGDHKRRISESELMINIIAFHVSHQNDFKNFYLGIICLNQKSELPTRLNRTCVLEVTSSVLVPLSSFLIHVHEPTGIGFLDSTSIKAGHNLRIPSPKVFKGTPARIKGQMRAGRGGKVLNFT